MNEIKYKYYVAEGESIAHVIAEAQDQLSQYRARVGSFLKKYEADGLWGYSGRAPFAIGWHWQRPEGDRKATPPMREYFLKPSLERNGDITYAYYKPDKRCRAGRAIVEELQAVGGFNFSNYICTKLKVHKEVFGLLNGRSVVSHTVAGLYGDRLAFKIPTTDHHDDSFTAPDGFLEIKKSEFIAITEEGV
ncbi:DUF5420 family protein [Desulfobotulus sp.]|uniref:DUF5420 family protein n=1 Tax=Desulfobotulus sp. TaxID=1940337 RepID=UPI002A35AB5C|nr:DUF5420 family protein [Desulfobotulus sp.]MDY0164630.1 DUF5420 family protein [Desulfobotulus sp.]